MILPEGVGNREWLAKCLFPCYSVALLTCHLSLRNLRYHMPTCIYRNPLADCTLKNSSSTHEVLSKRISETARNTLERKISCCLPISSSFIASRPSYSQLQMWNKTHLEWKNWIFFADLHLLVIPCGLDLLIQTKLQQFGALLPVEKYETA